MSRPIKYKFWDKEEKVMMGPNLDSERYRVCSYNGLGLIDMDREDEDGYEYEMDVEVLQWTGLCDRNGKEIYDRDLLQDEYGIGEVEWVQEHCAFMVFTRNPSMYHRLESDGKLQLTEVIGNIYTHPHLMEVSNT